jgi:hypothetical protein
MWSFPFFYNVCFPRANGIELIELGGIIPTSVTTAVMLVGGVKSYRGLRISKLDCDWMASEDFGRERGNEENRSPTGAEQ